MIRVILRTTNRGYAMKKNQLLQIIENAKRERNTRLDLYIRNSSFIKSSEDQSIYNEPISLPPEIGKLTDLTALSIVGLGVVSIPPEIGKLVNLKELYIGNNLLTELPAEIGTLGKLRKLSIGGNKLLSLPPQIGQLASLLELVLDGNQLSSLPLEITQLANLKSLSVMGNKLLALPPDVDLLIDLEELRVDYNSLTSLPPEIGKLKNLSKLSAVGNQIAELPQEIKGLTSLSELDLRQNPLFLPPEIMENVRKPQAVLNYYFSHLLGQTRFINEAKIIFIGQGNVGKTSLIKRLIIGQFNPEEEKTEGIDIQPWNIFISGQNIRLNIWDFGGQEIMHSTHQFFLTHRSLYVLVLDARQGQEENRVEYWLKVIRSFGGESPILVVGNKIDQNRFDINRRSLTEKYPNIKGFFETSCKDGWGIEKLQDAIAREVNGMQHIHDRLLESWFAVKQKIESLQRDYMLFDEYVRICQQEGIHDEVSQNTLIGFLHDLGIVLSFIDDPRLQDTNILNPRWVTSGVYAVLNSYQLLLSGGVLEYSDMKRILKDSRYPPGTHLYIVDMMRKFELCYDLELDQKFLIPDLLPKDEPFIGNWQSDLAFQYEYDVLPTSIFTRFIVRLNSLINNIVWRSGVILKGVDATALVKADYEERRISIYIRGATGSRHDFLTLILETFEHIHQSLSSINISRKFPHPEHLDLVLDYDEVLAFDRQGIAEFPRKIGSKVVFVNVHQILAINDAEDHKKRLITRRKSSRDISKIKEKAFISYSHYDARFTKRLVADLQRFGIAAWQDRISLKGGQIWLDEIEKGIRQCKYFLVILSPESANSDWVRKECSYRIRLKRKIIPILYKNCDLPLILNDIQFVDFCNQPYSVALHDLQNILR